MNSHSLSLFSSLSLSLVLSFFNKKAHNVTPDCRGFNLITKVMIWKNVYDEAIRIEEIRDSCNIFYLFIYLFIIYLLLFLFERFICLFLFIYFVIF